MGVRFSMHFFFTAGMNILFSKSLCRGIASVMFDPGGLKVDRSLSRWHQYVAWKFASIGWHG